MSAVATGIAVAGIASSMYSSNQQKKPADKAAAAPDKVYNAYGELNSPITGAIQSRDYIFNQLNSGQTQGLLRGNADRYAGELRATADGPELGAIQDYGMSTLRGDYLNSPVVANYARRAGQSIISQDANQAARTKAGFSRAGMGFSTGMAQALQASRAAASTKAAGVEAGILTDNYQNERAIQGTAPSIIQGVQNQRLNYLGSVNDAYLQPLQAQASLTTGLLGNQTIKDPNIYQKPTFGDTLSNGLGTAAGLYSMYKSINPGTGAGGAKK